MTDKIKNIPQQKLKAFSIGAMGKRGLSKKEMEEQRKREEEKAAAHAFQQFVETFQETPMNGSSKVWVKAGTYDAGARKEDTREKGKLYKPQSRLVSLDSATQSSAEQAQAYAKFLINDRKPDRLGKRKSTGGKSNLESFKEELRQIQEEREERHKYKGMITTKTHLVDDLDVFLKTYEVGSFDNGDPSTTNLYLGNLNPKITEQQLMEVFGRYGPLASIKIMWPRSDEEKSRGRNCGFVAYMARKDGERALRNLNGKDVLGYEMKLGWGKAVVIPALPIYVPPALLELSLPPPPSGLPFNAQPQLRDKDIMPKSQDELQQILSRSVVKVVTPTDRNLLMLIHRMVEFVVREGPMFEAMIMNREMHNPLFRFLFENQSPPHIYYRWKVYSIMHGDSQKEWISKDFRMFKDGSIWKPPLMNNYSTGMPDELINDEDERNTTKGSLSNTQRDRLEDLIRNLTPEAKKIGEAMVFCIEHSDAADEVCDCILESMSSESTLFVKKIARLYLISDILHNCSVKVMKASYYRRAFEARLPVIIRHLKQAYDKFESRLKAEGFRIRVMRTFKAWEDMIYPKQFMDKLKNIYLGIDEEEIEQKAENIDGNPVVHRDEDDVSPTESAIVIKSAIKSAKRTEPTEEYDGKALSLENAANNAVDGSPMPPESSTVTNSDPSEEGSMVGFIKSKWETVDPEQLEAQAMTTSKWDLLERERNSATVAADNDFDGVQIEDEEDDIDDNGGTDSRGMTEERRTRLREVEVKAVLYQDELESGDRSVRSGWTVSQQVEHFRRKLLRKAERECKERERERDRDIDTSADVAVGKTNSSSTSRHKRHVEYDASDGDADDAEGTDGDNEENNGYYKNLTSRKHKKHARSSSGGPSSKHRSKSRSPPSGRYERSGNKRSGGNGGGASKRTSSQQNNPSPPSPPRIRKRSPTLSPPPPPLPSQSRSSRSARYASQSPSPPPPRSSRSSRRSSPSPEPVAAAVTSRKHKRAKHKS